MNFIYVISYEVYMRISERGQITIPKKLRQKYGFTKDMEVEIEPIDSGLLIRKRNRGRHPVDDLVGVLNKPSSTDQYIDQIRGT
jgi:bifunctional DNA-binding transcriptional regulator/antitoxin component of YhaV-PrlF toxin-antitoxin module